MPDSGIWSNLGGYEFYIRDGDFLVYRLSWDNDEKYEIQYDIENELWTDRGTSVPNTVIQNISEIVIRQDGTQLGVFDNPYHVNPPPPPIYTVGGTISYADGYTIHTFTSSDVFLTTQVVNVEYMVVAGGGGGGYGFFAGGGGAGAFMEGSMNTGVGSVVIGAGGSGANALGQPGNNGSDSSFGTIISNGGGGGGSRNAINGRDGGSGGGGCKDNGAPGLTNQLGAGNYGGIGNSNTAGGGGGAGGMGEDGITDSFQPGRRGGDGRSLGISGTIQYYAGGGGAGSRVTAGLSASDIGGLGGTLTPSTPPTSGNVNTGSGGGGGGGGSSPGASGGSGIVIIRYITSVSPN